VALVVSVASLWVAYRQSALMERQLAASVWPSLAYDSGNVAADGRPVVNLGLHNGGIGPARIRAFELSLGGTALRGSQALLDVACGPGRPTATTLTSPVRGILPAGQQLDFLRVDKAQVDPAIWRCLDQVRFKLEGRVCFCSALDDCWSVGLRDPEPSPVPSCAEAARRPQYVE
jgi:hypothetical protein